jgi:alcohol dehydrogenase class IV
MMAGKPGAQKMESRMKFEFATAERIMFGPGVLEEAGEKMASMGTRAFIVTGWSARNAKRLIEILSDKGVQGFTFSVRGEPTISAVQTGVDLARQFKSDLVIGIGGGSALDCGKAVAALFTNPGEVLDYLEVVGKGQPLGAAPLPYVAIPTTAGTGSEVTKNAVLSVPEKQVKVSLRSNRMLPRLAVVDPRLTLELPAQITAQTGLDALTQLIEPYVSNAANPLTDGLCREGIRRAARSLRRAFQYGDDLDARQDMSVASLLGGLALANAKLGAVHGFAGPLGGMFSAPHGAICARLLPIVMQVNVQALQQRMAESPIIRRYAEVAEILTGEPGATAQDGADWVQSLCEDLAIPPLGQYGLQEAQIEMVVEKSAPTSSMKGNPILLTQEELRRILAQAI